TPRRECCVRSDLSVLIAGDIEGVSHKDIMTQISGKTSIPIVYVMKRLKNNFGHIHFHTGDDVELFCATVNEKYAVFPNGHGRRNIKCSRATGRPKNPQPPRARHA
ncbi:1715_t:CDS:2, partial [Paraglomus occultum]